MLRKFRNNYWILFTFWKIRIFLTLQTVDFIMETEREMTERWIKEAEFAIKSKFRKFIYLVALIVLVFLLIWYLLFKNNF